MVTYNTKFHLWGFLCFSVGISLATFFRVEHVVERQVVVEKVVEAEPTCIRDKNCFLVAEAIYHEARGEPEKGQVAVASVIVNRTHSPYFPDSIERVLRQGCHFSYQCDGSIKRGIRDMAAFQKALGVAKNVLDGKIEDPTGGADHYLNPKKVRKLPKWAREYDKVASIGDHQFHKRG